MTPSTSSGITLLEKTSFSIYFSFTSAEVLIKQIFELNNKIHEYADKFANLVEQQQTLNLLAVAKKKNIFLRLFQKK